MRPTLPHIDSTETNNDRLSPPLLVHIPDDIVLDHKACCSKFVSSLHVRNSRSRLDTNARLRNKCILDITKPPTVVLKPLHRRPQSLLPIHLLLPPKLMQLPTVDCVPQIIELPIGNEADQFRFLLLHPKNVNQLLGHLQVTNLILPPIFNIIPG